MLKVPNRSARQGRQNIKKEGNHRISQAKNNRLIVVLGMHRSGTSAISAGLKVLGVEFGDRLLPPVKGDNDKGYWEDIDLNEFNIKCLNAIDSDWNSLSAITANDIAILKKQGYFLNAVNLLRQKVRINAPIFGFKNPRVAKLFPFWKQVFDYCKLEVNYVLAIRHPLSVVKSLIKRGDMFAEHCYFLWVSHVITSMAANSCNNCVVVDYDRMMQSPDNELHRIATVFDLKIDQTALLTYKTEFLDNGLRHTTYELDDLFLDDTCPPIAAEIYKSLLQIASDKIKFDDIDLCSDIERWRKEFDRLECSLVLVDTLIEQKKVNTQILINSEEQNARLSQSVVEKDLHIANLDQVIAERDQQIANLNQIVAEIRGSTSWRLTSPIRLVGLQRLRIKITLKAIHYALSMCGGYLGLVKHVRSSYKDEGIKGIKRRILFSASPGASPPVIDYEQPKQREYSEWILRYDTLSDQDRKKIKARIKQLHHSPLISVLMPVYNPPLAMLEEAIQSVQAQLYPNWELCIADDASTHSKVRKVLKRYADKDARIKVIFRKKNGHISAASNSALELVTGDYLALLDNDDLLPEQALFWISDAIVANPDAGLLYSDEDKIDVAGQRYDPYFKPDWNPDLFLSHNMICHLGVYRTELVRKLGGFREGYEGAQDYDLALRCTAELKAQQIVHIPRVLYHWRSHPGSTAQAGSEKNYALTAGERSLNDHFKRINVAATVKLLHFGMYRASYTLPATAPLVSLVIPTRNGLALLKQCIDSILTKTSYKNYEILIVDNNSDCPKALAYFTSIVKNKRIRVLRDNRPFNYSALNNAAIKQAKGKYVALINNDIEVISPEWLTEMLSIAIQPGVGAVGARLLYPNDTLQHGGVITGIGGVAGHAHKHIHRDAYGYFARAQLIQTYSAVTAACLVIKKSIFHEVSGLDETNLAIAFNDIDFCLRVREAGYRNVWTPYAELYHHESASRGYEDTPEKQSRFKKEVLYMKKRWGHTLINDPAYNANLTLEHEDFSYAWPPRTPKI